MREVARTSAVTLAAIVTVLAGSPRAAIAIEAPDTHGRFDPLVVIVGVGVVAVVWK